ncbi:hypothetical protein SEVIR_3G348200v4 [Setaria viridis]
MAGPQLIELTCRVEADGQELPAAVAELPPARREARQLHRRRAAAHPRPPHPLGQPVVEDRAAPAGEDGQRDQELLEDPGAEARQAAQLRRQQQALQGRHALPLDAAPRRRRRRPPTPPPPGAAPAARRRRRRRRRRCRRDGDLVVGLVRDGGVVRRRGGALRRERARRGDSGQRRRRLGAGDGGEPRAVAGGARSVGGGAGCRWRWLPVSGPGAEWMGARLLRGHY